MIEFQKAIKRNFSFTFCPALFSIFSFLSHADIFIFSFAILSVMLSSCNWLWLLLCSLTSANNRNKKISQNEEPRSETTNIRASSYFINIFRSLFSLLLPIFLCLTHFSLCCHIFFSLHNKLSKVK